MKDVRRHLENLFAERVLVLDGCRGVLRRGTRGSRTSTLLLDSDVAIVPCLPPGGARPRRRGPHDSESG